MTDITRPVLRWHGGKWLLAPWIIDQMPPHRVYTEAFGGAASVLLRKPRAYAEIYNDLDGEVVNLFRVLRDPRAAEQLRQAVIFTPFSRAEFNAAYSPARGRVERARRLIIRSFMGFGSDGACGQYRTGFRPDSNKSGTTPAHDWANWPEVVPAIVARLRGMVMLCGYPHPMYDEALPGWRRIDRAALADGARARVECLWLNPAAAEASHPVLPLGAAA